MDKQERERLRRVFEDVPQSRPPIKLLWKSFHTVIDHIDALEGQKILLLDALNEAMGWNWLDEDVPPNIVEKCGAALTRAEEKGNG